MGEGIQRWEAIPQKAGQRQISQSPLRGVHQTGGAVRLGGAVRPCGRLQSFWEELQTISDDIQQEWCQQDGSTPHTAAASRLWLQQRFPGRVISLKEEVQWAPHSPDLSPLDFFLWGYLKKRVY